MVQHPQRIQALDFRSRTLLPVDPPEIHTKRFVGITAIFKIHLQRFFICHVKRYRLFFLDGDPHRLCSSLIAVLKPADSIGRMKIQRHPHSFFVESVDKTFGIRKELPVPGKAGPAASVFGIYLNLMPVHVNDCHAERNIFLLKTLHELQIAFFAVFIITAPPVSQSETRQHRRFSGQVIIIPQAALFIRLISEEIEIQPFLRPRADPAIFIQKQCV